VEIHLNQLEYFESRGNEYQLGSLAPAFGLYYARTSLRNINRNSTEKTKNMGACISTKKHEISGTLRRSENIQHKIAEATIELNMAESQLQKNSSKVLILHNELKVAKEESRKLKNAVFQMRDQYANSTMDLKRKLMFEQENAKYYKSQYLLAMSKLADRQQLNQELMDKIAKVHDSMPRKHRTRKEPPHYSDHASTVSSASFC
jgi:chromosome segregation ATPase